MAVFRKFQMERTSSLHTLSDVQLQTCETGFLWMHMTCLFVINMGKKHELVGRCVGNDKG